MNSDKEKERRELERGVKAFLQKGGKIQRVQSGRSADKYLERNGYTLPPNAFKPINASGGFRRWRSQTEASYKLHREKRGQR